MGCAKTPFQVVTVSHFHTSLVFAGKAGAYQSGAPYGTEQGNNSCEKNWGRQGHSSLLWYSKNYYRKKFLCTDFIGLEL